MNYFLNVVSSTPRYDRSSNSQF